MYKNDTFFWQFFIEILFYAIPQSSCKTSGILLYHGHARGSTLISLQQGIHVWKRNQEQFCICQGLPQRVCRVWGSVLWCCHSYPSWLLFFFSVLLELPFCLQQRENPVWKHTFWQQATHSLWLWKTYCKSCWWVLYSLRQNALGYI